MVECVQRKECILWEQLMHRGTQKESVMSNIANLQPSKCVKLPFSSPMYSILLRVLWNVSLVDMVCMPGNILISPFILVDTFARYLFTFKSWNISDYFSWLLGLLTMDIVLFWCFYLFSPFSFSIACLLSTFGMLTLIYHGDTLMKSI